jgi:hypothetical protein
MPQVIFYYQSKIRSNQRFPLHVQVGWMIYLCRRGARIPGRGLSLVWAKKSPSGYNEPTRSGSGKNKTETAKKKSLTYEDFVKETQKGPLMKTGEVIKDETRSK